jgi:Flp pilus assembly protein TadG
MLRNFVKDRRGQYAMMTAIVMLPLVGALAVGVDYAEMSRQRSLALNALDAAGIGTARRYLQGNITDAQLEQYARDFFVANAGGLDVDKVSLSLVLPDNDEGGGVLRLSAVMDYKPYFLPALTRMLGGSVVSIVEFQAETEVRLKNTLEVALVLDNSGSMDEKGGSSGKKRIDILKSAAKTLVDTLAKEGEQMKQVDKPVQFSLVPFASSVNVGPGYATASWMDLDGISPIHHENFDWTTMGAANSKKRVEKVGGAYYKKGTDWGAEENQKVTRFTLYDEVKRISGWNDSASSTDPGAEYICTSSRNGTCRTGYWRAPVYSPYASWKGCVEARPYPYNVSDTPPSTTTPATLFVPMFAPDEAGSASAYNNWWTDVLSTSQSAANRQKYMPKYFDKPETGGEYVRTSDNVIVGPNQSCTTVPLTTLKDVTEATGKAQMKAAIDAMVPLGGTNVPEGMAWGWRTISSAAPFTEGRAETEKGNDKVLIVVTDGANTYYTPSSLGYSDSAGNKSIYSSLGYARLFQTGTNGRIFGGTTVSGSDYSNTNYTNAMNQQFKKLCDNAKAAKVMVMTVALDLDASKAAEAAQINMLKDCASPSRFRKGEKLFWNSTGASLEEDFKAIGNELSNLRIVG